ncbi:MAG: putative endonuclease [Chitinophagales bacterium]|jgi:putative endonuclease
MVYFQAMGNYFIYIITNTTKKLLYTGVTNDLERRLNEQYKNRGNEKSFAGR